MSDSDTTDDPTYIGRCPKRWKILVREADYSDTVSTVKVRCPSCREHFHEAAQLDWRMER